MGIQVSDGGWGGPGYGVPDKQHQHLPFWYELNVKNTPPTPMEAWMRFGMMWMFPFAAPQVDAAAEWRESQKRAAEFIARRMGLKPEANFKVMQQGEHGLRFAFATLGAFSRYNEGMKRLHNQDIPAASNDPAGSQSRASVALLPGGFIKTEAAAAFTPKAGGVLKTFAVKGLRAANNKHATPKAQVLAFTKQMA